MLTFLTGAYLFHKIGALGTTMPAIWVGALAGTFMFLNVWLVIWPNQQIVLGMKEGDGPAAAAKAGLASRTNTLFSGPMLLGMLGNKYLAVPIAEGVLRPGFTLRWAPSWPSRSTRSSAAWVR